MLDEPLIDPLGSIVTELRADSDVATLVGMDLSGRVRVRPHQPVGPLRQTGGEYPGDARGVGEYQAFVVLATLAEPVDTRVPIVRTLIGVTAYGATYQNAREVWGAVVKAIHAVGARVKTNGLGIYVSFADEGGEPDTDPDTKQPCIRGTIRLVATAQAVT